jgi:hypothetical protein
MAASRHENTVIVIDAMALIVVAIGTAEAFFTELRVAFPARAATRGFRAVLLRHGRWLVAGLTFQRARDIIETSIIPRIVSGAPTRLSGSVGSASPTSELASDNAATPTFTRSH